MKTQLAFPQQVRLAGPLAIVALLACASPRPGHAAEKTAFEAAGPVPASRYLPAEQLSGPDWKVEPEALNDGYTNTYTLTSRFGTWQARGRLQMANRISEIQALAQLEKVSKSEVFLEAVKNSVTEPLQLLADVTARPAETVKGLPAGVGRWFKRTTFRAKETYNDAKEAVAQREEEKAGESEGEKGKWNEAELLEKVKQQAKSYALDELRISAAERRWYADLGVDPATDNEVLRKAVQSVARIEGLTSFGIKLAGLPSIPGASEMRKALNLVWETDPWDLRLRNRKILLAAGLSEETARAFEDNAAFSLSLQTAFLDTLSGFAGVAGREHLLARAREVGSRDEAQALVVSTALLLRLHRTESPLREFLAGPRLPVARTAKGGLDAVLLADAIFWTEGIAEAAQSLAGIYADESAASRRLFVVGEASARVKSEARKLGWEIVDRWQPPVQEEVAEGRR